MTAVSVVVPTHWRPQLLARLLESLAGVAYRADDLEVIVVGTASDTGRSIVERFARTSAFPVTYLVVPDSEATSPAFKRNAGVAAARGSIVAFTDDDCVVGPRWLAASVPLFDDARLGAVEGAVEIPRPEMPTSTYRGSLRLSRQGGYQTCNMLYRRSTFLEAGGFDLRFPYYMEDTDLGYSVLERGHRIGFAPDAIVVHPVERARPLKLLTMARTVRQMPYLFAKHPASARQLRSFIKPFSRLHYAYLALYVVSLVALVARPGLGITVLAAGLGGLLLVQLVREFAGMAFTRHEVLLTAVCQLVVPALRLYHWIMGHAALRTRRSAGAGGARGRERR